MGLVLTHPLACRFVSWPRWPRPVKPAASAPAALQAAVTRYRGQVRQCYERALKQNNMLQGRVTVTVSIGGNGRVESANASGNLGSAVNSCVSAAARTWQLVAPTGGTCATARVPFNMTPTN